MPESSRLEFLEKKTIFALSDADDNTSGPLNRGPIAGLSLLRTLLAIDDDYDDDELLLQIADQRKMLAHFNPLLGFI